VSISLLIVHFGSPFFRVTVITIPLAISLQQRNIRHEADVRPYPLFSFSHSPEQPTPDSPSVSRSFLPEKAQHFELEPPIDRAWRFFSQFGERPLVLAPMAEVNDLPFRLLCRRHGIALCYTGMVNATQWRQGRRYQQRAFRTCAADRPLVVQLAGGDPDLIARAAADLAPLCDAIDVNLGCTQWIARRGDYGFFMVDSADKRAAVLQLFQRLTTSLPVPVTAKIRVFQTDAGEPDADLTVEFARQLQAHGAAAIAVHGRATQRDKRAAVSAAVIRRVVEAVAVPVIANGGVASREEAQALFEATGAAGVMIGQALSVDPTAFDPRGRASRAAFAREYLAIVRQHAGAPVAHARKHLFQFYEDTVRGNPAIGERLKAAETVEQLEAFVDDVEGK
jgi:tRNA-dihydrouridine synthase 1